MKGQRPIVAAVVVVVAVAVFTRVAPAAAAEFASKTESLRVARSLAGDALTLRVAGAGFGLTAGLAVGGVGAYVYYRRGLQ